jgi:hypothetical protein
VAGVDKGRRTKIIDKEVIPGQHEIVQGGYGKYQGTWYTLIFIGRAVRIYVEFCLEGYPSTREGSLLFNMEWLHSSPRCLSSRPMQTH